MQQQMPRRRFVTTALAAATAGWAVPARACEFYASTLRVTHPWTRATGLLLGADTTTVLCMKFDEVSTSDRLIGVRTPIADGAVLAGAAPGTPLDLPIPQGSELELSEDGMHIRLTGLKAPVQVGRAYPLELHFENGGVMLAALTVDFPAAPFRFR